MPANLTKHAPPSLRRFAIRIVCEDADFDCKPKMLIRRGAPLYDAKSSLLQLCGGRLTFSESGFEGFTLLCKHRNTLLSELSSARLDVHSSALALQSAWRGAVSHLRLRHSASVTAPRTKPLPDSKRSQLSRERRKAALARDVAKRAAADADAHRTRSATLLQSPFRRRLASSARRAAVEASVLSTRLAEQACFFESRVSQPPVPRSVVPHMCSVVEPRAQRRLAACTASSCRMCSVSCRMCSA